MSSKSGASLSIGISSCLTGQAVRYDGGHKRQALLLTLMGPHVDWHPFCPEVAAGLGLPRPPVELVASSSGVRVLGRADRQLDVTDALAATARDFCQQLDELSGFILKSRSPSCGLGSAPLIEAHSHQVIGFHDGLFAAQLRQAAPWLLCADEEWLSSADHCRRFLGACAVTAHQRGGDYADLVQSLEAEAGLAGDQLIDELLDGSGRNERKAALEERLREFWGE